MSDPKSEDRRILVVEDETLIALFIEDALVALGCAVVGPVGKLSAAIELAKDAQLDAAILDVNVRGGEIFPVAEILTERGVPFVFSTGYGEWALPSAFRTRPLLKKPFTYHDIEIALQRAMGS